MRHVIFVNGPIGAGKTSLGRAAAIGLEAAFIDSDDLRDPTKRWIDEVLTGARALVRSVLAALDEHSVVIVAKPLRGRDWAFFRESLGAAGVAAHCVTLAATRDNIIDLRRGRVFSAGEQARIAVMIAEGYAGRSFSDLIVETDRQGFADTVARLTEACRSLVGADDGTAPAATRSECPATDPTSPVSAK